MPVMEVLGYLMRGNVLRETKRFKALRVCGEMGR